ncbi:MAG: hypothetical protein AAF494_13245 [Pseudomonadota bacterium]
MMKAIGLGAVLAWVLAVVIGSQGSNGGSLAIHQMAVGDYKIYWSWPTFFGGTGLAWGLMLLQR